MKTYQFKLAASIFCVISFVFALIVGIIYGLTLEVNLVLILSTIAGVTSWIGCVEDREAFFDYRQRVKETVFDPLVKKYYNHCVVTIDKPNYLPSFNNKKIVLRWAADLACYCQAYQYDNETAIFNAGLHAELQEIIDLSLELIDNKSYI